MAAWASVPRHPSWFQNQNAGFQGTSLRLRGGGPAAFGMPVRRSEMFIGTIRLFFRVPDIFGEASTDLPRVVRHTVRAYILQYRQQDAGHGHAGGG